MLAQHRAIRMLRVVTILVPMLSVSMVAVATAGDKGGTAGRTTLLAVVIREHGAFVGDPVDIRRLVSHQPMAVGADVRDADIVAHYNQDIWIA